MLQERSSHDEARRDWMRLRRDGFDFETIVDWEDGLGHGARCESTMEDGTVM